MRKAISSLLLIIALVVACAPAGGAGSLASGNSDSLVAFVNVNVIPMDRERALKNQTVVVRDGRVAELGDSARVKVPPGAVRIDGRGKYLVPGLIDMHTHLFSDDSFPDQLAGDELMVMLANGVTTARLMIGTPEHLVMREKIAKGEMVGPTLFVASPQITGRKYGAIFNGREVKTEEAARQAVKDFKAAGYDFIKITNFITRPVYDAGSRPPKRSAYASSATLTRR